MEIQDVCGVRGRDPATIPSGSVMPLASNNVRHRLELVTYGWSCQLDHTNDKLGTMLSINVNNLGSG